MTRAGRIHTGLLCAMTAACLFGLAVCGNAATDWTGQTALYRPTPSTSPVPPAPEPEAAPEPTAVTPVEEEKAAPKPIAKRAPKPAEKTGRKRRARRERGQR